MDVIIVDPWMLWGKDEVWVVDIMVDPWVNWRANVAGLTHGWSRGGMRSGWTVSLFWALDAVGDG